jgi:hypothetical protein
MAPRDVSNDHAHIFEMLNDIVASMARVEERVNTVAAMAGDLSKTIRGSNGDAGLVAKVDALTAEIAKLEEDRQCWKGLSDSQETLQRKVDDYPSYLWLLKNRTKQTLMTTIGVACLAKVFLTSECWFSVSYGNTLIAHFLLLLTLPAKVFF